MVEGKEPLWYWRSHNDWVVYPEVDSAEIERLYQLWLGKGGMRSRKNKMARISIDEDHEICFGELRQYRKYGDPDQYREVQRLEWADQPKVGVATAKPKGRAAGRPKDVATDSGVASSWAREDSKAVGRRAAKAAAADSSKFELRLLPCQDQRYKEVGAEMVHLFKMADNSLKGATSAAPSTENALRASQVSSHLKHLQRSIRQTQQYKSAVRDAAASAGEVPNFDPVHNFGHHELGHPKLAGVLPQPPQKRQAQAQRPPRVSGVQSARMPQRRPLSKSRLCSVNPSSARALRQRAEGTVETVAAPPDSGSRGSGLRRHPLPPPPRDLAQLSASLGSSGRWPRERTGPYNFGLAARTGSARDVGGLPQVVLPPSQSGEIQMSANGPITYRFDVRYGKYCR